MQTNTKPSSNHLSGPGPARPGQALTHCINSPSERICISSRLHILIRTEQSPARPGPARPGWPVPARPARARTQQIIQHIIRILQLSYIHVCVYIHHFQQFVNWTYGLVDRWATSAWETRVRSQSATSGFLFFFVY